MCTGFAVAALRAVVIKLSKTNNKWKGRFDPDGQCIVDMGPGLVNTDFVSKILNLFLKI